MAMTDENVEPWHPGVPQELQLLKPLPSTFSAPLRDLIERGLLHPSFEQRLDAEVAYEQALRLQYGGAAATSPAPDPEPTPSSGAKVRWEWQDDGKQWRAYEDEISRQLEAAQVTGEQHVYFDHERHADLLSMKQHRWDDSNRWRRIRRHEP